MSRLRSLAKNWLLPPGLVHVLNRAREEFRMARLPASDRALLAANRRLEGRHAGSRCFVLGAGSSIAQQDLRKLGGEFVISVSNTFVHPDYAFFRPRYHVVPSLIEGHGEVHTAEQFNAWLAVMAEATGRAEMFFHIGDRPLIEGTGLFRDRIVHWVNYASWDGNFRTRLDLARVPSIWSVSELALTVALVLGFEKIYLIGFDHDWFNGPLVYFYDHTREHVMKPDADSLAFADSEFQMRRHAEMFRKYKYLQSLRKNVFNANANPRHYLDVFPTVGFDALFPDSAPRT